MAEWRLHWLEAEGDLAPLAVAPRPEGEAWASVPAGIVLAAARGRSLGAD
ncbi:hypothetical protein QMO56_10280 [Roseomonas sp. E05]|nr:hypothetical protein [Roseomonas sp. E05]MDJ0388502.1 hypothetical protein [Roseomonas sp. E05]